MDEDRTKGMAEKAKGKVKEVAGKVTGNERLEGEGKGDQVAGQTQKTYGEAKDTARDVLKK
ncbi:MAG: CsbD family protein [Geminicoccaceae bacterium]|nr:CsbD family protein [Geminicoccaceae bacterium]